MVDLDTSSRLRPSTKARMRRTPAIALLAVALALSSGLVSSAALAADTSLSIAEKDSAFSAGLSPEATADRVAQHVLDKNPWPAGLIWSVPLEGLMALYDATGNRTYLNFARDTIRAYDESKRLSLFMSLGFSLYLRTRDLEDLGAFVARSREDRKNVLRAFDGVASFYQPEFAVIRQEAFEKDEAVVMKNEEGGGNIHLSKEMSPIWLDYLSEYTTRMARTGLLTGEHDFHQEALSQYLLYAAALRDPQTGLWGHGRGWYGTARDVNDVKFGRAQAWLLRAFGETLPCLPSDSPEFKQVHAMMLDLANALLRHQDKDGFWHQVADRPDSFQETSSTGLISYYLARAVRQGYLPREGFEAASRKAFAALSKHRISSDGIVHGGAMATAPLQSLELYMSRPTPVQDPHAVGAVMMAAAGQLLLDGKGHVPVASRLGR